MNKVFLLLGGNLGDRFKLIEKAKNVIITRIGEIKKESSLYETAPWGFKAEQDFLNQVIIINTNLSSQNVLRHCLDIESELGRERKSGNYESRTMDIDILFFNDEIIQEKNLTIPHPKLHKRRFTLEPLVEIAADFVHPVFHKKLTLILDECEDESEVFRLDE